MDLTNLKIISAGAGSGKTYRLTKEMVDLLSSGEVKPSGIIATTFTRKAAAELQERVRVRLLEAGLTAQADELTNALIGTVHGLGVKLLRRFAFEAGVSPQVDIVAEEDQQLMFNQSLAAVLALDVIEEMDGLCDRLGLNKRDAAFDWRGQVRLLVDVARANDFSLSDLDRSRERSWATFAQYLPAPLPPGADNLYPRLERLLQETQQTLRENEDDATKATQEAAALVRGACSELQRRGFLHWHHWVKLSKLKTGAKSRELVEELQRFCQQQEALPEFQKDIRRFIDHLFGTAIAALREYEAYKKRRGLIDYTDMEVLVKRLLDNELVAETLSAELDLLMVDEFQDTSPIQLEIFLKLSRLARHSVWVGDPKQSIYGFRGAEPRLMQAIIQAAGGIRPENVQDKSWRSRAELVYATNAIFIKAFPELPPEQVALNPVRARDNEPPEMQEQAGLVHWHFVPEDDGRVPGRPWLEDCIARALHEWLDGRHFILPKESKAPRPAEPGDVAILCRSNSECVTMAEALHGAGLRAAIARSGLVQTAEATLILACLKYLLNEEDSLSVAEILLLASGKLLEDIVDDRLDWLDFAEREGRPGAPWGWHDRFVQRLTQMRRETRELSSAEMLNLVLEELDLRRIIAGWGKAEQRLSNVDELRRLALQYEDNCNRVHSAASLGGFLLWLGELARKGRDLQGASEDPQAVNVLTYHKSKGLEWPVVICHSLEQGLRADLWGIDIVAETETVDLNNVLGGRWLRYWVNPYSDQFRGTPLCERLEDCPEQAIKRRQAREEEARLLYVGLTRARDVLIFTTRRNPTSWINRVYNEGNEEIPTLDPHTHETPWGWNEEFLNKETRIFPMPRKFPVAQFHDRAVPFLEPRAGRKEHTAYFIEPREQQDRYPVRAQAAKPNSYGRRPQLPPDTDPQVFGRVLKAFLLADGGQNSAADRRRLAAEHLLRFDLEVGIEPEWLLRQSENWHRFLEERWPGAEVRRRYPVRHLENGQCFEAVIDWVVVTSKGLIVLQNSTFTGEQWERKATELAPFLYYAGRALEAALQRPVLGQYVNFVNLAQVAGVTVAPGAAAPSAASSVSSGDVSRQATLFD